MVVNISYQINDGLSKNAIMAKVGAMHPLSIDTWSDITDERHLCRETTPRMHSDRFDRWKGV